MNKIVKSEGLSIKELQRSIQTEVQVEEMNHYSSSIKEESEEVREAFPAKRRNGCKKSKQHKKNSNFTLSEDQLLLKLVQLRGPKFKIMKSSFKGKSVSVLKNRYYKNLRYRWSEILGDAYAHFDCQPDNTPRQSSKQSNLEKIENLFHNQPNLYPETKQILEQMLQGFDRVFSNDY